MSRKDPKLFVNLLIPFFIFLIVVLVGSFVYNNVEGWSPLNSIYFVVATMTTIGYGDLVPLTSTGKIFTIFFSIFGIAIALYFLSVINSFLFKKHVTKNVEDLKKQVKEEEGFKNELKEEIKKELKKKKK